jgi:hypothetical protein
MLKPFVKMFNCRVYLLVGFFATTKKRLKTTRYRKKEDEKSLKKVHILDDKPLLEIVAFLNHS